MLLTARNPLSVPLWLLLLALLVLSPCAARAQVAGTCGPGKTCTSNRFRAGDGTALAPAYSFINDGDTGLYRPAANQVGVTVEGTRTVVITSNGVIQGVSSLPSLILNDGVGAQLTYSSSLLRVTGGAALVNVPLEGTAGFLAPVAFASFPAAAAGNTGRLLYDSTNGVWRVSNGSAWQPLTRTREFAGYMPVAAIAAAQKVASTYAHGYGIVTTLNAIVRVAGTGVGSWTATVFDVTSATTVCTVVNGTCAAPAQTEFQSGLAGCSGVVAAGDQLLLRLDTAACDTAPALMLNATILGG